MRLFLTGILLATAVDATAADERKVDVRPAPTPAPSATAAKARGGLEAKNTNRIVGGNVSAGRPFLAALLFERNGSFFQYCGASVVERHWLLTAAHCKVEKGDTAIINRRDLSEAGGQKMRIVDVRPHAAYDDASHDNDIALLRTSADISASIRIVTLGAAQPPVDTRVLVAGWGLTEENGRPVLKLREVDVPIVDPAECKQKYGGLTGNMLCAGEADKDSCQGDSGGPLFQEKTTGATQLGIVSYGVGCGRKGWPGVYTRVDQYSDWIRNNMR